MKRVAAEVAQEIGMLLEDDNLDTGARAKIRASCRPDRRRRYNTGPGASLSLGLHSVLMALECHNYTLVYYALWRQPVKPQDVSSKSDACECSCCAQRRYWWVRAERLR